MAAVVLSFGGLAEADEYLTLTVSLREGHYSLRDFYRSCNTALGTAYDLESIEDRELSLTPAERLALEVARQAGLLHVEITPSALTLRIPNHQDARVRLEDRRRLERLLGIPLVAWPPELGLHLPDGFDPARRTILLIHGLESGRLDLERFAEACRALGIQPLFFDYPNDGPPAWSGERLSQELKALAARYPRLGLVIVAHSMGGLVARYCLETPGLDPGCVTDLVTLGTPHQGTHLAGFREWVELAYKVTESPKLSLDTLRDGLGEAADDLQPGSDFLAALNGRPRNAAARYHVGIGRRSFLAADQIKSLVAGLEGLRADGRDSPLVRKLLAILRDDAVRVGHGDGAVAVQSARLHGAFSERLFDLNHTQLISLEGDPPQDGEVVRWVIETLDWQNRDYDATESID